MLKWARARSRASLRKRERADPENTVIVMTSTKGVAETAPRWLLQGARNGAVAAVVGFVLAFAGPFGSYAASLGTRLAYWVPLLLAGAVCATVIERAASTRPAVGSYPALRWAFFTACITAPMWLCSWGFAHVLFGPRLGGVWSFLWPTALISGAMTALMMALNAPGPQTLAAEGGPAHAPLRARLPAGLRTAEIFAASAEDHYLRIHTSGGSTLILMRLSDAIGELRGIEGAQVHRSWWIARAAIVSSKRSGRNVSLVLKGDLLVPVSRPNVRALQESGWL